MIQQDTSRREEMGIVELWQLGEAYLVLPVMRHGRMYHKFMVLATKYNRVWPGHNSDVLFVVEGHGQSENFFGPLALWGFYTEQECYDFLTGYGPKEYHSHDLQGNPISEVRERLNIPDAFITRYKENING
jgi:hypothetical protein